MKSKRPVSVHGYRRCGANFAALALNCVALPPETSIDEDCVASPQLLAAGTIGLLGSRSGTKRDV